MRLPGQPSGSEAAEAPGNIADQPSLPLVLEVGSQEAVEEEPDHELVQVATVSWLGPEMSGKIDSASNRMAAAGLLVQPRLGKFP